MCHLPVYGGLLSKTQRPTNAALDRPFPAGAVHSSLTDPRSAVRPAVLSGVRPKMVEISDFSWDNL